MSELTAIGFAKRSIAVGSLSFSLASRLLGKKTRDHIVLLYAWCRYCDDAIDSLPAHLPEEHRLAALADLRTKTTLALGGKPDNHPVFQGLSHLAQSYALPAHYPLELLAGMEMDIHGHEFRNEDDLDLYCYRVAGTVGLMFCHIAGISDLRAQRHACDLGMAMQLTNIARDIMEDHAMERVYLPKEWLLAAGISGDLRHANRDDVARVVSSLLKKASDLYQSGEQGLVYLPLRAALAAAAARYIYGAIGDKVRRRGAQAWDSRVVVNFATKIWLLTRGMSKIVSTLPRRFSRPFQPVSIERIWRLTP